MDKNEKGLLSGIAIIVFCVVTLVFACGVLASGQLVLAVDEIADSQSQVMNSLIVGLAALLWVLRPLLNLWKKRGEKKTKTFKVVEE